LLGQVSSPREAMALVDQIRAGETHQGLDAQP
jgi:hypothetical protein